MKRTQQGFTLIELMLVLVIGTVILVSAMRLYTVKARQLQVNHMSLQMQQIMEAATSYYIAQYTLGTDQPQSTAGTWPLLMTDLTTNHFLPASLLNVDNQIVNPWGNPYKINSQITDHLFQLQTTVPNVTIATLLENTLPIADAISGAKIGRAHV